MGFWTWIVIIIAVTVVVVTIQMIATSKRKQEMELRLKSLPDFNPTQQIMGCDGNSGLAVDESRKNICLITNNGVTVSQRVIGYKDIVSAELFEDGTTVTKTMRSSQVGGAVVGGLLFGGLGALVGGLTGKTETSGKVKRIDLRLIVNSTNEPLHDVAFMNVEGKKDGIIYTQAIQAGRRWYAIAEILIKRADSENGGLQNGERGIQAETAGSFVAEKIAKLTEPEDSGALPSKQPQPGTIGRLEKGNGKKASPTSSSGMWRLFRVSGLVFMALVGLSIVFALADSFYAEKSSRDIERLISNGQFDAAIKKAAGKNDIAKIQEINDLKRKAASKACYEQGLIEYGREATTLTNTERVELSSRCYGTGTTVQNQEPSPAQRSASETRSVTVSDPRVIFTAGAQFESDELLKLIDNNYPNSKFHPDESIDVISEGKRYVIQTQKITFSGPAIYKIISVTPDH
jgi:hypothetical protein